MKLESDAMHFCQEYAFQNVICKMAAILFDPQSVHETQVIHYQGLH